MNRIELSYIATEKKTEEKMIQEVREELLRRFSEEVAENARYIIEIVVTPYMDGEVRGYINYQEVF